jgi:hypothetical protein
VAEAGAADGAGAGDGDGAAGGDGMADHEVTLDQAGAADGSGDDSGASERSELCKRSGSGEGPVKGANGRRTRKPHRSQNWLELGFPHHGHLSSGLPAGRGPPAWCLPTTRTGLEAIGVPQASQKSSVTES